MFRKRNSLKCSGLTQQKDAFGVTSSTTWERLEMFCGSLCKNTLSCVLVRLGSGESSLFKNNFLLVTSIFVTLWQCAHALTLACFHVLWHLPVSWHLIADILPEKKHPLGFFLTQLQVPFFLLTWCYPAWPFKKREPDNWEILIVTCEPLHVQKGMAIEFPIKLCDDIWGIWFWKVLEDETHFWC